jgi:hypothetical protein
MIYACGTNAIIKNDVQVSKQRDRMTHGDDHQKEMNVAMQKLHDSLNILSIEIEYTNTILSRCT